MVCETYNEDYHGSEQREDYRGMGGFGAGGAVALKTAL